MNDLGIMFKFPQSVPQLWKNHINHWFTWFISSPDRTWTFYIVTSLTLSNSLCKPVENKGYQYKWGKV
jgi:hypothetical protein